jgi:outer membrane immunogenic protein
MGWLRTLAISGAASATSNAPRHPRQDTPRRSLRAGLASLALIIAAPAGAMAADMPEVLRGSYTPTYARWEGFYVGGQAAYLSGGADFGNATQSLVAFILRNTFIEQNFGVSSWTTLGKRDANSSGFGGFAGYNSQWDDVVLGLEVNYVKTNWQARASDSISRFNDTATVRYAATVDASSSIKLIDYASIRGRAGYTIDQFMPYALVGFVVGRADILNSVTVTETETALPTPPGGIIGGLGPTTNTEGRTDKIIYGYSAGLGLDVALTPNIFMRAEYEYIQFFGLGGIQFYLNTARAGIGLKF